MTAICPSNGPSQPIPGKDLLLNFTAAGIIDLITTGGMSWFATLASAVGFVAFNLTDLCTKDPPPMPNLTAQRVFSYGDPNELAGTTFLLQDVTALLANYVWHQYCQCVTGSVTTTFTPIPEPPGQQTNDPSIDKVSPNPCHTGPSVFQAVALDSLGTASIPIPPSNVVAPGVQWAQIFNGAWEGSTTSTPLTFDVTYVVSQLAGTNILSTRSWVIPGNASIVGPLQTFQIAPGATSWSASIHADGQSGHNVEVDLQWSQFCSSPPQTAVEPCCPPDPVLEQLIIQVLRLEQLILNSLGGSSAYVPGAQHVGRTGAASLSVSGLRGMQVGITAGTPTTPELPGNPPYEWNLGWMSILSAEGMLEEKRITRQHQVWLPVAMPLATTFSYLLNPGVVATFTELEPA